MIGSNSVCALLGLLSILVVAGVAAAGNEVGVPPYGDAYSKFVKQLEAGQTNINYTEFRLSFLNSEQFKIAGEKTTELSNLRKRMHELMRQSKHAEVAEICRKMLGIDYTDMEAHKILRQASKLLGDNANAQKHHDIEFGLLNSIVKKGDGKTCQTAWPVIQVTEEYFILDVTLGARVVRQSIDNKGGLCDKMEVETDQGKQTYYFDINKVFQGYNKRGIH